MGLRLLFNLGDPYSPPLLQTTTPSRTLEPPTFKTCLPSCLRCAGSISGDVSLCISDVKSRIAREYQRWNRVHSDFSRDDNSWRLPCRELAKDDKQHLLTVAPVETSISTPRPAFRLRFGSPRSRPQKHRFPSSPLPFETRSSRPPRLLASVQGGDMHTTRCSDLLTTFRKVLGAQSRCKEAAKSIEARTCQTNAP